MPRHDIDSAHKAGVDLRAVGFEVLNLGPAQLLPICWPLHFYGQITVPEPASGLCAWEMKSANSNTPTAGRVERRGYRRENPGEDSRLYYYCASSPDLGS